MWPGQGHGRGPRVWRKRAVAIGAALLLVCWAVAPNALVSVHHHLHFPTITPAALAHYLADFSNHAMLYSYIESWTIESEWSNYTTWRYEVKYKCGARCNGYTTVTASSAHAHALQHGAAPRHRVLAHDQQCTRLLPLLPWPALCEETETETLVVGDHEAKGEGSQVSEIARARCSLLARCTNMADLLARRELHMRALASAFNINAIEMKNPTSI